MPVNASSWAQIGGSYTLSSTVTALFLYAQLIGPSSAESFYVDDVVIDETSGPPPSVPEPQPMWLISTALVSLMLLGRVVRPTAS